MTQKEAINELMFEVEFTMNEIEQHEKFEDEEQDEYQIRRYEDCKKRLDAYLTIFGALDPSLSTIEGLRERISQVNGSPKRDQKEPSDSEVKLAEILSSWYKKAKEENGGYATELELTEKENLILAKINVEVGNERVIVDEEDPDEIDEASEDDTFDFYPYRGRVQVIYNGYADGDFCSYPEEFQEKAYEIIKAKLNK